MGADAKEDLGTSSANGKASWSASNMEIDDDDDFDDGEFDYNDFVELGESRLASFCKKAASAFFRQHGLVSHQINSYNDFILHGIKRVFESIGEITVEPGYDPSKKGDGDFRYALVRFGDVSVERPTFYTGEEADGGKGYLDMYPRHARLQHMTYSARIKVKTHFEVYTQQMKRVDKFKTGKEQFLHKEVVVEEDKDVLIGRIPVMVYSDLCRMKDAEKGDCDFDHGGYFIVKGAEKAFIAQEQICLNRLWISSNPFWKVSYRVPSKKKKALVKLVENPKAESIGGRVLKGAAKVCLGDF